jgi:hypothetical protein
MNKIKEINNFFLPYKLEYENIDLPFLDWICAQCNSNIGIVNKFWFKHRHRNDPLWHLCYQYKNYKKFLFL